MTRTVEARLRISAQDKTGNVFRSVAGKLDEINKRATALNQRQAMLADSSQAMYAAMLRYAAPTAIAYGLKTAIVDFAAVERRMNRIGNTADASAEETRAAFQTVQQAAKDMALPIDQGIEGLETLTASGMSLKEALAFLPAVLTATQASGAAAEDIANTALKAASALKLEAGQMQNAFDIMVTGGKAGQFELKDMAAHIPTLANSFATLGYSGEEGLKRLVAILQTLREDTGTAESAATQAGEIFGKIYAPNTVKQFKNLGIDLRKELKKAEDSGEDVLTAFVRLSREAVKGDLKRLPELFGDKEFRLGMQSLLSSPEALARYIRILNSPNVKGSALKDAGKMIKDTQGKLDQLGASWDGFVNSLGGAAAPVVIPVLDQVSKTLDYISERSGTVFSEMDALGKMTPEERITNKAQFESRYKKLHPDASTAQINEAYHERLVKFGRQVGGRWSDVVDGLDREKLLDDYVNKRIPQSTGRPGSARGLSGTERIPVPTPRPRPEGNTASYPSQGNYSSYDAGAAAAAAAAAQTAKEMQGYLDFHGLTTAGEDARRSITDGAGELKGAGDGFLAGLRSFIGELSSVASRLEKIKIAGGSIGGMIESPASVKANTGPTMPPSAGRPAGQGPR